MGNSAKPETKEAPTVKKQAETVGTTVQKVENTETKSQSGTIIHKGYHEKDYRQEIVRRAYEKGGMDFVKLIECESAFKPTAIGDNGHAFGLCQMNNIYHNIPQAYYDDWGTQIDYCYDKWKGGTKFYGPSRIIKGKKCADYVNDRFIFK